ncbi:NAD(P)-dependent alcohol dehydrogenase, partial [Brevundimonas sp.]|uniref:NAD(P)-dependent alcohol dehydrogenase n=1 Tax=Brevundimonas sp. TaxID=1871086 RepID=UPI003517579A
MPIATRAFAAVAADKPLEPYGFDRRDPGPDDVAIEIKYCGVCHSDLHIAQNDLGNTRYPIVPGHEIAGIVTAVGSNVTRFKEGDRVGVGCMVDSCRICASCQEGLEQYCVPGMTQTYGSPDPKGAEVGQKVTQGGYSDRITVDQNYVLSIPDSIPLDAAAPLLCAGITTYSPLKTWGVGPGSKVAVVGLGGLGHRAVKLAAAMGAEVTVLSTSDRKKADAERMGAKHFLINS